MGFFFLSALIRTLSGLQLLEKRGIFFRMQLPA